MDKEQLDPFAEIMIQAYWGTASYRQRFLDEYEQPPTNAAKAHQLRSIAQARLNQHDRFGLSPDYAESGRVAFLDYESDLNYVVRSHSAVSIEQGKRQQAESLFDSTVFIASAVQLLIFKFRDEGLDLSVSGSRQIAGKRRVEVSGTPTFIGTWPYSPGGPTPFNQGLGDPFADLGDISDEEAEGEGS